MKHTSIEVHVKDTISVIPDRFEYMLSVVKNYTNGNDEQIQQEQKVLEQIVNKNGYKKRPSTEQVQTDKSSRDDYVISFDNIPEVISLYTEVAKLTNVEGVEITLQSRTYSKEEEADRLLIEKLLKKAQKRANYLSKLLKKSLGEMVAVVDKPMVEKPVRDIKQGEGSWVVYPPISAHPQILVGILERNIMFEKEMVVRFRLKD